MFIKKRTFHILGIAAVLWIALSIFISTIGCAQHITSISITTSLQPLHIGDSFLLLIDINPTEPIGGWSVDLHFTPGLIEVNNVSSGGSWSSFFDPGTINDSAGVITAIQSWSTDSYPTTNHALCTIRVQAIQVGVCFLSIEQAQVTNTLFQTIPVAVYNITVTIVETPGGNDSPGSNDDSIGYLIDTNQDGTFDLFHNNETENDTAVQKQENNRYLIDSNGVPGWDYVYDPQTKKMTQYIPANQGESNDSTSLFIVGGIGGIIVFLFVILFLFVWTRKNKPLAPSKVERLEKPVAGTKILKKSTIKKPQKMIKK